MPVTADDSSASIHAGDPKYGEPQPQHLRQQQEQEVAQMSSTNASVRQEAVKHPMITSHVLYVHARAVSSQALYGYVARFARR